MNELLGQTGLQAGAGGVVVLIVLMILTGRLITRRQLEDVRADCEARLRDKDLRITAAELERDTWRTAAEHSEVARLAQQDIGREGLELSHRAVQLLQALPQPAGQGVIAHAPLAQLPSSTSS